MATSEQPQNPRCKHVAIDLADIMRFPAVDHKIDVMLKWKFLTPEEILVGLLQQAVVRKILCGDTCAQVLW